MKIISIVLAFIAFGMCFFGWNIIVFGPLLITFCAVISIILSIMMMNKDNDKMLHVLSIIISGISILIAIIFLGLQIYVYTTSSEVETGNESFTHETILTEVTEVEIGVEVEIEDGLFVTIHEIYYDTQIEGVVVNYDIKNVTREDILFNQSNLYYTSDNSIEPTYLSTTLIEPLVITAGTNLVLQQSTIKISDDINTLGYINSKGDSFEIPITTN